MPVLNPVSLSLRDSATVTLGPGSGISDDHTTNFKPLVEIKNRKDSLGKY
jgi:hypothetical protein